MAEHALYVPHSLGTVIGSRQARPWVARDAQHGIDDSVPWRGQPVFPTPGDAFAWLEWADDQDWLPAGLAVAHITAWTDPTAEGLRRVHIGPDRLRQAVNQVVRPYPGAGGPDPRVLAACYGIARADAMRTWLLDTGGATARQQRHAALTTAWDYGYRIAARDGRAVQLAQVARAVRALLADPTAEGIRDAGVAELRRLNLAATTVAGQTVGFNTAFLPEPVFQHATSAELDAGYVHGWDAALAVAWKEALRLGALHGAMEAATDIEAHWRADPDSRPDAVRIQGRRADRWLADVLLEANRNVASQWMLVTAQPLPAPPPQPDAADAPLAPSPPASSAGRAFPADSGTAHDPPAPAPPPPPSREPGMRR